MLKNEIGNVYSKLRVVSRSLQKKTSGSNRPAFWNCICECGVALSVRGDCLRYGNTKSCGCLASITAKQVHTKHGHDKKSGKTPTYQSWANMMERCRNPKATGYENYGGRGIKVCDRWVHSFESFLEDMGLRPINTSIDRKNNDGDYEPSNCRWADRHTQNTNKRIAP